MKSKVTAVVGAQYGSEGKGAVVQHIAHEYDIHVRTGGPNAGHTIHYEGNAYAMQVIPCGWINPDAILIIGIGALVDIEQLEKEIGWIEKHDPHITERLFIDKRAGWLAPRFQEEEGGTKGEIHKRIGSTGKGVGAARAARMDRDDVYFTLLRDGQFSDKVESCLHYDTSRLLHQGVLEGRNILLEGAQGSGLSLIHGPWPYVTSADTNAAQMLADCGLPPSALTDCILVARTYPIRVAGNSGPLAHEVDWDFINKKVGYDATERTTVTKKVRRIGLWDSSLFVNAVRLNGPTEIAITFADYMFPECAGATSMKDAGDKLQNFVDFIDTISYPAKVKYICTGPGKDGSIQMIKRELH